MQRKFGRPFNCKRLLVSPPPGGGVRLNAGLVSARFTSEDGRLLPGTGQSGGGRGCNRVVYRTPPRLDTPSWYLWARA